MFTELRRTKVRAVGLGVVGLCAALGLSTAVFGGAEAQAADGRGDGKSLRIAVAADGFALAPGSSAVDIVPNEKFPGTVQIRRVDNGKCLATNGGKNDSKEHGVQWTGCNSDASKNWLVEPYATDAAVGDADSTLREANVKAEGEEPGFILRSWKYPQHCLFSGGYGLDGRTPSSGKGRERGITPNCTGADTDSDDRMRFAVLNDVGAWQFLRGQMVAGAVALSSRDKSKEFAGENLWVKPLNAQNEDIGAPNGASADGYFLPSAIAIDPARKDEVIESATAVVTDCPAGGWWWDLDNTTGGGPSVVKNTTSEQHTDTLTGSWSFSESYEWQAFSALSVTVKIGTSLSSAKSTSVTEARDVSMEVPAGKVGMAIVSTPAVSMYGRWKSGSAFNRTWTFDGSTTIALKEANGLPVTSIKLVASHSMKKCTASAPTSVVPMAPFHVALPEGRIVPRVGDELRAHTEFVEPTQGGPLDVRYQWFADDRPIVGQTGAVYRVTNDTIGRELSFKAYDHASPDRFESPTYFSQQTPPVVPADHDPLEEDTGEPIEFLEGVVGSPYEVVLAGTGLLGAGTKVEFDTPVPGLEFDSSNGTLSGIPTEVGVHRVSFIDENGTETEAVFTIEPAPTYFPATSGMAVRVGDELALPLVEEVGSDAQYDITVMTPGRENAELPRGVQIQVDESGIPWIEGVPEEGGEWIVRVDEDSPHPDTGDARPTSHEVLLQIDDSALVLQPENEPLRLPLGQPASVQIAEVPLGADPLNLIGELPPGLAYDPITGELSGTPQSPGMWSVSVESMDSEPQAIDIEIYGAPEVSIDLIEPAEEGDGTGFEVGEYASWLIHAPNADELSAIVKPVGSQEPVEWAVPAQLSSEELELDMVPAAPGDYVIEVSASNGVGTTREEHRFTVSPSRGGSDGETLPPNEERNGEGGQGSGGNQQGENKSAAKSDRQAADEHAALARTGAEGAMPVAVVALVVLALGAGLLSLRRFGSRKPSDSGGDAPEVS